MLSDIAADPARLFLLDYDGTVTTNSLELLWGTAIAALDPSLALRPVVELMKHAGAFRRETVLTIVSEVFGTSASQAVQRVAPAFESLGDGIISIRSGVREFLARYGDRTVLLTETVLPIELPTDRAIPILRAGELGKASHELYARICATHGFLPEHVCVVDDCYFALRAAKRAGLRTVLVRDEPGWDDTIGKGVDRVVTNFFELGI
jgi:HAD superfamily hydrolase (TIGR01509 family)